MTTVENKNKIKRETKKLISHKHQKIFAVFKADCPHQKNKVHLSLISYSGVDGQLFDSASSIVWTVWGEHGDLSFCAAAFWGAPGAVSENRGAQTSTSASTSSGTHSESSHGHVWQVRAGDCPWPQQQGLWPPAIWGCLVSTWDLVCKVLSLFADYLSPTDSLLNKEIKKSPKCQSYKWRIHS